jgi:hypothetical protein
MKTKTVHRLVQLLIIVFAICCMAYTLSAQETTLSLPTNDNTSSFNITKDNGTSIFKVDGSGRITGDGSGLSNTKPLINYIQGNQMFHITKNYGHYDNVRQVTLTVPGPGIVWATVTGYIRWESTGWDVFLGSILADFEGDPNDSWIAEDTWYYHLLIATDYACADSSDQYTTLALQRCIPVNAGTHTFTFWANKYTSSAKVRLDDVCMVTAYFPTAGTGKEAIREEKPLLPGPGVDTPNE